MHSPLQKQPVQAPPAGPATLRARAQSQQAARVSSTPQACAGARGQIASIAKEAPSSVRLAPRDCNKKQQASLNDYLRIPFLPPSSASRILAARATRLFAASGRRAPGMPPCYHVACRSVQGGTCRIHSHAMMHFHAQFPRTTEICALVRSYPGPVGRCSCPSRSSAPTSSYGRGASSPA